jgi:hypothetical protein
MSTEQHAAYADRLRRLAAWLEDHQEVPLPASISGTTVCFNFWRDTSRADLAAAARAFGLAGWQKRTWSGSENSYFEMARDWAGWRIELTAYRDAVCTRVVTGTEERPVEEIVTPAVTRTVVKPVETIEWVCEPVMAPAGTEMAS